MRLSKRIDGQIGIIAFLALITVILAALGTVIHLYLRNTWLTVLDVVVTGILSTALVVLYFRQTTILESQKVLLTQELNREARRQHTETLRDRVRIWHGEPDRETSINPIDGGELNIPTVYGANIDSAPTGMDVAFPEEEPFLVVPNQLQGDRYLQDLLDNHAPDLRERKVEIEELQERFVALREEFTEEYDDWITKECEDYSLEPEEQFADWIFDLIVMERREYLEDSEDLLDRAKMEIDRGETGIHRDKPIILVRAGRSRRRSIVVYSAVMGPTDPDTLQAYRSEAADSVKEILPQIVEAIDDVPPYNLAFEAADVLDDAEAAVEELEHLLLEYEGRPIYTGDCEYLEEARI